MRQNLPHPISLVESAAAVIEQGLANGRWAQLPGERALAAELEIGRSTVRKALALLTRDGHLGPPSQGRRRSAGAEPAAGTSLRALRIALLTNRQSHVYKPSTQRFLLELKHAIEGVGHELIRGLPDLAAQSRRRNGLSNLVSQHKADVWLINCGTWDQLEFFCQCPKPVLAIGGRSIGLEIAGIGFDQSPGMRTAIRELLKLGHRRIVFLCERFIREAPQPGKMMVAFREELEAAGVAVSSYNFPEWDDTPTGLQRTLEDLFRFTPPTAMIVNTPTVATGILGFCNTRRLRIPEDLSMVVGGDPEDIAWFHPSLSLIRNETPLLLPAILRWIEKCAQGRRSVRQLLLPASFQKAESIGPAPRSTVR
jgi:DNA-binding LacI/PurR family transcriptional regulator